MIYKNNGTHYISLKDNCFFSDGSKIKKLELMHYEVFSDDSCIQLHVYVYENDSGIDSYGIYENKDFIVADSKKATIRSFDPYLSDHYLFLRDRKLKSSFPFSLNGEQYIGDELCEGDTIEYLGFRLIYFRDFLYVNQFMCENRIPTYQPKHQIIEYPLLSHPPDFYLPEVVKEPVFEDIKEFSYKKDHPSREIYKTLMANFVMSAAIASMAYLNYSQNAKNISERGVLSYLIMPISMTITGILFPIVFHLYEKRKDSKAYESEKKKYLIYLDEYKNKVSESINNYVKQAEAHFFSVIECKKMIFYATEKSNDYLTISLGKANTEISCSVKPNEDKEIDRKLEEIRHIFDHIESFPVFLDLKESRIVTIISKKEERLDLFKRYLLEVSYKHHPDEVYVAIYCKDISMIGDFYSLPHLFYGKKRMTLNHFRQIQELDRTGFDRPLILFLHDDCNYEFRNPNIRVLYFTDHHDIYKKSDTVIEYLHTKACIHRPKRSYFSFVHEKADYQKLFHYLDRITNAYSKTEHYSFSEIFRNHDIEASYQENDRKLRADFSFSNGRIIDFDLHENGLGPHGLIGGSTGSGKSELIISMLLSLCVRYSPEYLNIILIDYKGEGVKESLSYQKKTIPHIIASVSNLENHALERLVIAINNECVRRQRIFKEISSASGISVMNLDDYLDCDYQKLGYKSIAHLMIVVDEFAELKKEHGDQIKELISLSRIGRSLGIHLILATQKPSGNISDEIWSNSHFKISLKVFEERDSLDIIKTADAAYLSEPGSFLLRVDDSLTLGTCVYSKNDISGNDPLEVCLLDNVLDKARIYKKQNKEFLSEASYFCRKLLETCDNLNIYPQNMDFMAHEPTWRIPMYDGNIHLGETDDYLNNVKEPLTYSCRSSLLICSSRKKEINVILNALKDNQRKTIVIGRKLYDNPVISDSLLYDQDEDIEYLFGLLMKNDEDLTLVIEDLYILLSYQDTYTDTILKLIKRSKDRNFNLICLSESVQIGYKLVFAFTNKIMIEVNDSNDVSYFFAMHSKYKGNSFYFDEEPKTFVPVKEEEFIHGERTMMSIVKKIPDKIDAMMTEKGILLGYDLASREAIYAKKKITVISYSQNLLDRYSQAYGDKVKTIIYDHPVKVNEDCLWLGPGALYQRIFVYYKNEDLDDTKRRTGKQGKDEYLKVS
ncbi:MAG: hypothetical protein IJF87_07070 [Erysipelotrichaceae bacterium]|nr:hypothetical protein [Erysipelotrichaceae bacterium]